MIIVRIQGGLGNQMFEYASGYGIARKTGQALKFDLSGLDTVAGETKRHYQLDVFGAQPEFASPKEVRRLTFAKRFPRLSALLRTTGVSLPFYVVEKSPDFDETMFSTKNDSYLNGYWQSEKYFSHVEQEIRNLFHFKNPPSDPAHVLIERAKSENSIALQVRRGDYVTNSKTAALHGTLDKEYYQKAIAYICTEVSNPVFFIISDDTDWVMKNIEIPGEMVPALVTDYEQMGVMISCKNHIISNSSFGWWGAWLGEHPDKIVVAPKKWFLGLECDINDRLPTDWVKL